jgi:hypothetical protein
MTVESLPPLDQSIIKRLKEDYKDVGELCNTEPSADPRWK